MAWAHGRGLLGRDRGPDRVRQRRDDLERIGGTDDSEHTQWIPYATVLANGVASVPAASPTISTHQRVELMRYRVSQADSDDIEDPADGFMIWLEPQPATSPAAGAP